MLTFGFKIRIFLRIISMECLRSIEEFVDHHTSKADQQFKIAATILDPCLKKEHNNNNVLL